MNPKDYRTSHLFHVVSVLIPSTNQLLTTSSHNPHIRVPHTAVRNESSRHTNGKGDNDQDGVCAYIRKPNAIAKLIHVFGGVLIKVEARFGGHCAGGHG